MPIKVATPTNYLQRTTGSFLSTASDFTYMFSVKANDWQAHSLTDLIYFHLLTDNAVSKYIREVGAFTDGTLQELLTMGVGTASFTVGNDKTAYSPEIWINIGVIYHSAAHNFDWYVDKFYVNTYSANLSTTTFQKEQLGNASSIGSPSFRRYRSWQRALTGIELIKEFQSETAIVTTDLFCDTPLTDNTDLADVSGNGRDWTLVGSATTDTFDLGIVTGHANNAATAAEVIPSLPYAALQDVNSAGSPIDVWYSWTADEDCIVSFGAWGCNDDTFAAFIEGRPGVYLGPASAPVAYQGLAASNLFEDQPVIFTATQGVTYYLKILKGSAFPSSASIILIQVVKFAQKTYTNESFFINAAEQTSGAALAAVLDYSSADALRKLITGISQGEGGDRWADGTFILDNQVSNKWDIYTAAIILSVANVNFTTVGSANQNFPCARINRATDTMYLSSPGTSGTNATATTVDKTGVVSVTIYDLNVEKVNAIAPAPGDDYIYFAGVGTTAAGIIGINRIKLSDSSIDVTWIAGISGFIVNDILTMNDGTIVVLFMATNNTYQSKIRVYDNTGSLLHTYSYSNVGQQSARLAHDTSETHVWMWDRIEGPPGSFGLDPSGSGRNGRFQKIKLSDGTVDALYYYPCYDEGHYGPGQDLAPGSIFGPSSSCPFFLLEVSAATITVTKTVVGGSGGESFNFTAGGGLTPTTFSLGDGDSQVFSDVSPGTYSIVEDAAGGFTTTYEVTGGQDPSAIEVVGSEDITVAVTNTAVSPGNPLSGIYKIVPNSRKTNDTVYTNLDPVTTEDQEIPDPFFKTTLIGE